MKTAKATRTQAKALADAVKAAYDAGWEGSLRKTASRPSLRSYRSGITEPTRLAMEAKGLIEWTEKPVRCFVLTSAGVAIGKEFYEERYGVSAEQAAEGVRRKKQADEQAQLDKHRKAQRLFRGLNTAERRGAKSKSMSSRIKSAGPNNEVRLSMDDLIALGEGIEKLR